MRHNRRDDGQLSCRKREMKTMNANTALDGHTTVIKMAERGGVPLTLLLANYLSCKCLHDITVYIDRAQGRRLGAKSNRYARTEKSSNSLIRFRCSNSCFLLETGIADYERLFFAK